MNSPTIEELFAEKTLEQHRAIALSDIRHNAEKAKKLAENIEGATRELAKMNQEYAELIYAIRDAAAWFSNDPL